MDTLIHRMMHATAGRTARLASSADPDRPYEWTPSADISETDTEYLIRAELPGVSKDAVKVTLDGNLITIEGERKEQREDDTERLHRRESFTGIFMRSFALPENAEREAIRCESKDGIVTAHIPKVKVPSPKAIEIKVE
jgi:HSP20 family protein